MKSAKAEDEKNSSKREKKLTRNKKPQVPYMLRIAVLSSDRDRIRTYDRLLRRQMLYPAELRDQFNYNMA